MKTLQEIFDKAALHLLTQDSTSANDAGLCRYRGEDGKMCAVGCLIKDEFYTTALEEQLVSETIVLDALTASGISMLTPVTELLLIELQKIHDQYSVRIWENRLRRTAKNFHLSTLVIDNFQKKESDAL